MSVCLTPDGQWVMSGSKDRGVQFWDPVTGNAQMMLQGHKNSGQYLLGMRRKVMKPTNISADSDFGCARPNRQPLCDRQWRHACADLEVSQVPGQRAAHTNAQNRYSNYSGR